MLAPQNGLFRAIQKQNGEAELFLMARLRCKGWEMKGQIPVILLLLQIVPRLNSPPQALICYTGANPEIYALLVWIQGGIIQLMVKTKSPPCLLPALSRYRNLGTHCDSSLALL